MKKTLLSKLFISFFFILIGISTVSAQKTVTANVPADGLSPGEAVSAVKNSLQDGDSLILTIDAGTYARNAKTQFDWDHKHLNVLIKGAGADKTIIKRNLDERPGPDSPDNFGLWQIFSAESDSVNLTVQGITFIYGGSYTNKGQAFGVALRLFQPVSVDVTYENCIFESNTGMQLFYAQKRDMNFTFNNCMFKDNLMMSVGNGARCPLITARNIESLTVKNCTFMSNEIIELAAFKQTQPSAIYAVAQLNNDMDITLENNAFINTRFNIAEYDTAVSVVQFEIPAGDDSTEFNIVMNNNIFLDNIRPGKSMESDILLLNPEQMNFTGGGNILNKVLRLSPEEGSGEYLPYGIDGFRIDSGYTYEDPRIEMDLDFGFPLITKDEFGIGHVSYHKDGSPAVGINRMTQVEELNAYVSHGVLNVQGLKVGERIVVVNILGSLIYNDVVKSEVMEFNLPRGMFIVRSGKAAKKVFSN